MHEGPFAGWYHWASWCWGWVSLDGDCWCAISDPKSVRPARAGTRLSRLRSLDWCEVKSLQPAVEGMKCFNAVLSCEIVAACEEEM